MTRKLQTIIAAGMLLLGTSAVSLGAQVAGSTTLGVSVTEVRALALGMSVKRQVLGKWVYNEKNEAIGTIDDVIVAPNRAVSYAIINAHVWLHLAKHDVAIPVSELQNKDGRLVLPYVTQDALKAMPTFEYAY